jgi:DNA polymerase III delta prime subunit
MSGSRRSSSAAAAEAGIVEAQAAVNHLETRSVLQAVHDSVPGSGRSHSSASVAAPSAGASAGVADDLRAAKSQIQALQRALKQAKQDSERKDQQVAMVTGRYDKEILASKESQAALKTAEQQLALVKKEIAQMQSGIARGAFSGQKGDGTDVAGDAARLRKAELELKSAKEEIAELKSRQDSDSAASQIARLTEENRQLTRQRGDLLLCLRKQNKLIDVLKRQKLHLEAAKLLQLTEAEYTEAVDRLQ